MMSGSDKPGSNKKIVLLATGGTIAFENGALRLRAADLAATVDDRLLGAGVEILPVDFESLPSSSLTPADTLRILEEAEAAARDADGVVVTHGTDTMEEAGYLFSLHWQERAPLVLTGAMRPATTPGADGPRNLLAACLVAADARFIDGRPLVVMHDKIFAAGEITKVHSWDTDTFAGDFGPLGSVNPWGEIRLYRPQPDTREILPRPERYPEPVAILMVGSGGDGSEIDALVSAGYRGVVVAAAGRGGIPRGMKRAIDAAIDAGVIVVVASRCPLGGTATAMDPGDILWSGEINAPKARLRLMTGLAQWGPDRKRLSELF